MWIRVLLTCLVLISPVVGQAQDRASERFRDIFCDYVPVLADQIQRQRERQVPFSRLDIFNYFDPKRAAYLREIAVAIYAQSEGVGAGGDQLSGQQIESECLEKFEGGQE